ncbi:MAG TPA: hypothetical protein VFY92_09685, partial [Hyphomicrobiaceae bacterium]|nr:hypothetical protein [Hyphomicrobiaceae bacterium]
VCAIACITRPAVFQRQLADGAEDWPHNRQKVISRLTFQAAQALEYVTIPKMCGESAQSGVNGKKNRARRLATI